MNPTAGSGGHPLPAPPQELGVGARERTFWGMVVWWFSRMSLLMW